MSGRECGELREVAARLEDEHAAVPEIIAGCHELLRDVQGRLLDELCDRVGGPCALASPDVAIAGFRRVRDDPEGHELAVARKARGNPGRLLKPVRIANHVIGRRDDERGVRIDPHGLQCRQRDRRRGITADGLEQNGARMDCHRAQLLGDREAMRFVADHDRLARSRDARQAKRRLLQHGALAGERQELLRIHFARQRPEPRARAARQDYRYQRGHDLPIWMRLPRPIA